MNLLTCLMPRPRAEGRRLFSAGGAAEQPGWRLPLSFNTLKVLEIRRLALAILVTAGLCLLTISHLAAADPSVEVFAEDRMVTAASGGYSSLLPQLPFRWSLTTSGGYDDNVDTTPEGAGSPFTQANLTLSKDLRTERTQLTILVDAGAIHYFDRKDGPPTDYTGDLNLSLQHGVSERLTLAASINAAYQAEPAFGTDLGPARRGGNYFNTFDTFAARYALSPRLSTYTSYQLSMVKYENDLVAIVDDRVDHAFGESLRYLWSPRTTLIAEYRFELIDYDTAPRDSTTHLALGGLEYQVSSRLNATVLGGATFRKFKEGNGERLIDPNWSASLRYLISPSTSLNWTASYSVEEPNFSETLTQTTVRIRTGLQLRYQPSKRVTANLEFNYHHDENTGLLAAPGARQEFTQNGFQLVLDGKYALADRVALNLKFAHTDLDSIGGYSRNVYTAGLVFSF